MPYKYPIKKGWHVPKQSYTVSNWREYNQSLRQRGRIEVWLTDAAIEQWYEKDRAYDGTGTPLLFSDFAIIICHEIRQVFRLPLRQCQGFIDSLFQLHKVPLKSPDYTCLSKRLSKLQIKSPRYKKTDSADRTIVAIAIDSTGLKRFGKDEWHQEKHKISGKRSWRKLHIAVDDEHYIQATQLTKRWVSDDKAAETLLSEIHHDINHFSADGAYDKINIYKMLNEKYPDACIAIPPRIDAVCRHQNHPIRNDNCLKIKKFGRMAWQEKMEYGRRNLSELCIKRYKHILGNKLYFREMPRQVNEAMIGCGILNKMTSLGMPKSHRRV